MRHLALAATLCLPAPLWAGEPGYLDLFYAPKAKLDVSGASEEGNGFGLKGWVPLSAEMAFTAEYQSATYDDAGTDTEADQVRFGLGVVGESRSGIYVEYLDVELDGVPADGFAVQGRVEGASSDSKMYGQIGYVKINDDFEDLAGMEYLVGVALPFNASAGGFVDYRRTKLEGDSSGVAWVFTDIRLGVRINF